MLKSADLSPDPVLKGARASKLSTRTTLIAYLFLLPTVIMILVFNYYPAIAAFWYSFTDWNGFTPPAVVGLRNFKEMFTTEVFSQAFLNLLWLSLFRVAVAITVPLLVAFLIYKVQNPKLQNLYRMLFVFPLVIPMMVVLLLWQFLLNSDVGLINAVLSAFGMADDRLPIWLGSPDTALLSIMLIGFPWVDGVAMLIYLAGFQSIPRSIVEAATMDGASGFRKLISIELPLVLSQVKLILILTIIGTLQGFQTQLVLTGGGPGYSTTVPGLIMYQEAMSNNRLGFACAVGVVLFILIFSLTLLNNKYLKSSTEYGSE